MIYQTYILRTKTLIIFLFIINFSLAGFPSQNKTITMTSRRFPGGHREDGMWTALSVARDGKVYLGLSTAGNSAHFYIYDPARDTMRHRADLSEIVGDRGKGIRTSGKIHTPFVEDHDGNIYFASSGNGPTNVARRSFEGGHWFRYNRDKDEIVDLGLVLPHQGVYALVIDKKRNRLYGTTDWGHFVIFDIQTRKTISRGKINIQGNVIRHMVIDDRGFVYGNHDDRRIFRYNPDSDRIEELTMEIPADKTVIPRKSLNLNYYWRAALWDEKRLSIYGIERISSTLSVFVPGTCGEGEIRPLAQLCADPYLKAQTMPRATLAFTIGKDDKIYYAPVVQPFDYTSQLGYIDNRLSGRRHYSHLVTYDLISGERVDHGMIRVEDDRPLLGAGGAATGMDGSIYFCGAVEVGKTEQSSGRVSGRES